MECLDTVGAQMVGLGRAVEWHGPAPVKRVPIVEEIATREPVVENRDPKPVKKK